VKRDSVESDDDLRERSMMGRRERRQGQFFYTFDLDKVVPADHLVRQIDGVLISICWPGLSCSRLLGRTAGTRRSIP
jgi:hypothetical protein